jgi:hypothetical protein
VVEAGHLLQIDAFARLRIDHDAFDLRLHEGWRLVLFEAGEIEFPPDFEIQFLTPEQRMKKLVLAVPELIPPQNGQAEQRNAEDYQTCTYYLWRS